MLSVTVHSWVDPFLRRLRSSSKRLRSSRCSTPSVHCQLRPRTNSFSSGFSSESAPSPPCSPGVSVTSVHKINSPDAPCGLPVWSNPWASPGGEQAKEVSNCRAAYRFAEALVPKCVEAALAVRIIQRQSLGWRSHGDFESQLRERLIALHRDLHPVYAAPALAASTPFWTFNHDACRWELDLRVSHTTCSTSTTPSTVSSTGHSRQSSSSNDNPIPPRLQSSTPLTTPPHEEWFQIPVENLVPMSASWCEYAATAAHMEISPVASDDDDSEREGSEWQEVVRKRWRGKGRGKRALAPPWELERQRKEEQEQWVNIVVPPEVRLRRQAAMAASIAAAAAGR